MFLNEVALGKEHHITMDDSSLVAPPKGFDSVVAKGRTEPGKETTIPSPLPSSPLLPGKRGGIRVSVYSRAGHQLQCTVGLGTSFSVQ